MLRRLAVIAIASLGVLVICFGAAAAMHGSGARHAGWMPQLGPINVVDAFVPRRTEARQVTNFTRIDASVIDVNLTVGPAYSLEVTGPDPRTVITEVRDGTLYIGTRPRASWQGHPHYEVHMSMPALEAIRSSAGADFNVNGVDAEHLALNISSGADMSIAGVCHELEVHTSSGADLNASRLACVNGHVSASSGGDANVAISGALDVDASSGGDVNVRGAPTLGHVSLSSGSDLHRS